jgi:hypothetical protein
LDTTALGLAAAAAAAAADGAAVRQGLSLCVSNTGSLKLIGWLDDDVLSHDSAAQDAGTSRTAAAAEHDNKEV